MAKIVANENAPAENAVYSVPGAEFTLKQGGSYSTDDRAVLVEAEIHPWLSVEYDKSEAPQPAFRPDTVSPADDALSAEHSEAFDPKAVARDRELVLGDGSTGGGTAIDAGLDQDEVVTAGDVAVTLAADAADAADDETDTPKKRKS